MKLRLAGLVFLGLCASVASAEQEVIPPAPPAHFNDYASVVRPETAQALDAKLDQYERATSNQIVVAVYPKMQSESSVEDYTVRVAQSWHAGLKGKDNGVVLFVFVESHKIYINVGYGLEGAIPDATAKRIISDQIAPAFRQGDYDGGLTAGVNALLAAAKGEYKGSGSTVADGRQHQSIVPFVVFLVIFVLVMIMRTRGAIYNSGGRRSYGGFLPVIFPGGGGGGFGGGGGGGGGFSGGGGSFGGGGAGGKLVMSFSFFGPKIDHDRVVAAIASAEATTSGEIRVIVARHKAADPVATAQDYFNRGGMANSPLRNGVLIFVAPRSRNFAIIGDSAVHEKCGDAFWTSLAKTMAEHFKAKDFTAGVVHGVERAGELLAKTFPRSPGDASPKAPSATEVD